MQTQIMKVDSCRKKWILVESVSVVCFFLVSMGRCFVWFPVLKTNETNTGNSSLLEKNRKGNLH